MGVQHVPETSGDDFWPVLLLVDVDDPDEEVVLFDEDDVCACAAKATARAARTTAFFIGTPSFRLGKKMTRATFRTHYL